MAPKAFTVGPGSLIFGETGTPEETAAQVTAATVEPNVDSEDDLPVLSGDIVPGEDTFTAVLKGNLLQDIGLDGFVSWTWTHKGEVLPFVYIPNSVVARQVAGECKIVPIAIGGEVKTKARSDFEFACVGFPVLGDTPAG